MLPASFFDNDYCTCARRGPRGKRGKCGPPGPRGPQGPQGPPGPPLGDEPIPNSLIPAANNTYDLGSPSAVWRDLYLGGNSIYVYSQPNVLNKLITATESLTLDDNGEVRITTTVFSVADFNSGVITNYTATGPVVSFALSGKSPGSTGAAMLTEKTVGISKTVNTITVQTYDQTTFKGVEAAATVKVEVYQGSSIMPFATATFNPGDTTASNTFTDTAISSGDTLTVYLTDGSAFDAGTRLVVNLT